MYYSDGSHQQMEYLRKAYRYCKKACEYMEKAMRCPRPYRGDRYRGYERHGDCHRPRRYSEYRRSSCHMDSSSCHTHTGNGNLLDT